MELLLALFVVSVLINGAMFLVAYRLQSDKLTDVSYAVTFIVLALTAYFFSAQQLQHLVLTSIVGVWALRIGSFLLYRVIRTGKDRRFDGMRENFWQFAKFWAGQALTVWVLMLPAGLVASQSSVVSAVTIIGLIVWGIGVVLESAADFQKYAFNQNPANKGQWIDSGVWRYSRHPNYFGEILVWVGVYLVAVQSLSTPLALVGLLSPLFIIILLLFVSGIPLLEKSADQRWGSDKRYQAYKRSTSILVPFPKRRSSR